MRLELSTQTRCELIDITERVRQAVRGGRRRSGAVLVFCPHTTAGITIQENADPDVRRDLLLALENAVPETPPRGSYLHAEGNSTAHAKASLVGASQLVPVRDGDLVLGTWQAIYFCEFDGPRSRHVEVQMLGE